MRITVSVKPNAKSDSVSMGADGTLSIRVAARPVDGKANEAVERLLAGIFGVPRSRVSVVRGHSARHKQVEIELDEESVGRIMASITGQRCQ